MILQARIFRSRLQASLLLLPFLVSAQTSESQLLTGTALVKALRHGGYVLVMRHASSPSALPDQNTADADNIHRERQLDEQGRSTALAMGKALRDLKIPVGEVLSSPTYRALETARIAQLGKPITFPELGDNGKSMQGGTEAQAIFLRKKAAEFPSGTNTIIVTHLPNIQGAFPKYASGLADGEVLVFGSGGNGGARLVGRIKIEEWPKLRP